MRATITLKELEFPEGLAYVDAGAAFIDLRDVRSYLEVHIPGAIGLAYESGPGLPSRARDCLPLEVPLVLLDLGTGDLMGAAAALRGKGFDVVGRVVDANNSWAGTRGSLASTEVIRGTEPPSGAVLEVGDPGAPRSESAQRIPIERLWSRLEEVPTDRRVVVTAGRGIRAAMAVGMLERHGVSEIAIWTRPSR